jgi:hypothetical protein
MRYRLLFVFLFIACLTATGCSHNSSNNPLVLKQTSNGFTAQLTISQDPVPVMKETTLTLNLHDPDGQPVPNAAVRYDLTMPGMTMPPNQPQADEKDNGVYEAKTIFTMAGDWRCRAEAEVSGGVTLEFTFDFKAK